MALYSVEVDHAAVGAAAGGLLKRLFAWVVAHPEFVVAILSMFGLKLPPVPPALEK
jgi:hypothetical protein